MDFKIHRGFSVFRDGKNDVAIVTLHSGPALEIVTSRDDNSETVASLCWKKIGGNLIISNMPRKRWWGIDFNRDIPTFKSAVKAYQDYEENPNSLVEYRRKYAWISKDSKDYEERLRIYQKFWEEVIKKKDVIFIHRAHNRIKTLPSIIDVVSFEGKGVKKSVLAEVIKDINTKYYRFFKGVENDYKDSIVFETKRVILNILRIYKTLDLDKIGIEFKSDLEKDLKKIDEYADKIALKRLRANLTPQLFIEAVKNSVNNAPTPEVTIENVFSGSLAHGPYRKISPFKDRIVIEIEPTYFMNFWHPHIAAEIISDIFEGVRKRV